jgi:hypothetical protein
VRKLKYFTRKETEENDKVAIRITKELLSGPRLYFMGDMTTKWSFSN